MIKYLRERILIFSFLIISTLVVWGGYLIIRTYENQRVTYNCKAESLKRKVAIEQQLNENINILRLLQVYFQKNQVVNRNEFSRIVKPILELDSSLQAIEWIPRVVRSEKSKFEELARRDGYNNFYLKEYDGQGDFCKVALRDFYYPIYFIEPFVSNQKVFGVDIGTYSFTLRNLEPVVEKNGLAISSGLKLMQDSSEFGFVIYLPVYVSNKPKISNNFLGFIAGVYKTSKLIEHSMGRFPKGVEVKVLDKLKTDDRLLIYSSLKEEAIEKLASKADYKKRYYNTYRFNIENLDWQMEFYSIPKIEDESLSRHTLFYGLLIVMSVTLFLILLQRHSSRFRDFNNLLKNEISQRILFEKELRLSEEKFSKLFYTSPIPITFIRLSDRTLVDVNSAFVKKFGYTKNSILGKTTKDLGIWESNDTWESYYDIFYEKGEVVYLEAHVRTTSGDVITCILSGSSINLQGENYMFTYYQDITDRKNAENKLKQSEEKYRDIFNSVSDALIFFDVETAEIEDVNFSTCDMYKYSKEEFLGQKIEDFPTNEYPYSNNELEKYYLSRTGTKRSTVKEWLAKDKDGKSFWVEINYVEMFIGGKQKVLTVVRNINERKKAESLLIENEFLFRIQFNNSNIGIAIVTPEGQIIRANKKICNTLGYSEEELQEKHWVEYSSLDNVEYENALLSKMVSGEIDGYEIDKQFIKKDGENINAHLSLSCFRNQDSSIHYIIAHIFDITDRIETEKKIFKAIIKTEENERARFAQELHDGLGPILSSIKIYIQWMAKPNAKLDNSKALKEIEGLIEIANQSVREIAFGLSPHILKDFGLYEALKSFTNKIKSDSTPAITISCNLTSRIDETIETVIYRVLIECINNSIKHSQAENIEIGILYVKSILNVEYKDNGIGFQINELEGVSKGMGLYNIQNRIKSINGDVVINSSPGYGTTIKISIKL